MLNSIKKTAVLLLMSIICLNASAQLTIVKQKPKLPLSMTTVPTMRQRSYYRTL